MLISLLLDVPQDRRHCDSSFMVDSPVESPECQGLFFFFRYQYDIWEVKIKTRLWAWNIAQRLSVKCERPIFAQSLGCIQ